MIDLKIDFILAPVHLIQKYELKVFKVIWLLLPAAFANMAPVLGKIIFPNWNKPIDSGLTWKNKEIFGAHKTYRGFCAAIVTGFFVFCLQQAIHAKIPWMRPMSIIDYNVISPFFGAWLGFCAITGDLIKSFFKRRLNIPSGQAWVPFDEIDWIVASLGGLSILFIPSFKLIWTALLIFTVLDFITNWVAAKIGLKPKAI